MAFGDDTPRNAGQYRRRQPTLTAGKMGIIGLIAVIAILALMGWLTPPIDTLR
jgi:hypothetical protein